MKWSVQFDVYVGRRRRVHRIIDAKGNTKAVHQDVADVFQWLVDNDVRQIVLDDDDTKFLVEFEPTPW